jgi:hypothetical protein
MPRATEMRNDIFIADHGSTRETVSLTRRARAAAAAVWAPAGRVAPPAGRVLGFDEVAWLGLTFGAPPPCGRADLLVWPAVLTRYLH